MPLDYLAFSYMFQVYHDTKTKSVVLIFKWQPCGANKGVDVSQSIPQSIYILITLLYLTEISRIKRYIIRHSNWHNNGNAYLPESVDFLYMFLLSAQKVFGFRRYNSRAGCNVTPARENMGGLKFQTMVFRDVVHRIRIWKCYMFSDHNGRSRRFEIWKLDQVLHSNPILQSIFCVRLRSPFWRLNSMKHIAV